MSTPTALMLLAGLLSPLCASAQQLAEPGAFTVFQGGVPSGQATADEIPLTLADAIARGLRSNLGAILGGTAVEAARGARRETLADLLPQLGLSATESRQKINLAAYGFSLPGVPQLVGPFDVFDARAHIQQSVFDLHADPPRPRGAGRGRRGPPGRARCARPRRARLRAAVPAGAGGRGAHRVGARAARDGRGAARHGPRPPEPPAWAPASRRCAPTCRRRRCGSA